MLFNSYLYLFVFLPAVFAAYFLLHGAGWRKPAMVLLLFASILFYSYWNVIHLLRLLLLSLGFNFWLGRRLARSAPGSRGRKGLLAVGLAANVGALIYFKYTDFFIANINAALGTDYPLLHILLPLGISFFTFQEMAYLVDSYRGETEEYSFVNYALFVTFFPQLVAGPIVHHREMMSQFGRGDVGRMRFDNVARGLFILSIGLFKKVCVADTFARWATPGFDQSASLGLADAWITSLSYTAQLYYDFSGYTDMAIGAALLFNVALPINFNSPYKALDIQDFWRRWHMTLSRFLRDYLYVPLGGSRRGFARTCINLFAVFLIGGIWHGAGWTFAAWGALHGAAMVIHLCWRRAGYRMPAPAAWLTTFLFVNVAWVFFRARSFDDALKVLKGMAGLSGGWHPATGDALYAALALAVFVGVSVMTRNSVERLAAFRPSVPGLAAVCLMFGGAMLLMNRYSEFIYFNF